MAIWQWGLLLLAVVWALQSYGVWLQMRHYSDVFKGIVHNYTRNPERRFSFRLGIDPAADLTLACETGIRDGPSQSAQRSADLRVGPGA